MAYDQRPKLCSNFPYDGDCHHEGCHYRKGVDYLIKLATDAWEALDTSSQVG